MAVSLSKSCVAAYYGIAPACDLKITMPADSCINPELLVHQDVV